MLKGHKEPVTSVAYSPDGAKIGSGSVDKTIRLWDPATGALLRTLLGVCVVGGVFFGFYDVITPFEV